MKIIYKGEFHGDENTLPHGEHVKGAIKISGVFSSIEKQAVWINLVALFVIVLLLFAMLIWRSLHNFDFWGMIWGFILSGFTLTVHELLHAICFKEKAYLYTYFSKGMFFVTGTEHMSKRHFISISLFPNLVLGALPCMFYLFYPFAFIGAFGICSLAIGIGDYCNVYSIMAEVPNGAKIYLYQLDAFWYNTKIVNNLNRKQS